MTIFSIKIELLLHVMLIILFLSSQYNLKSDTLFFDNWLSSTSYTYQSTVGSIIIFMTASITLKQWIAYLNFIKLYKIFENSKHTIYSQHECVKVMIYIIYLLYNIIVNYYFLFCIDIEIAFNFSQSISCILILTFFSIPYYIIPVLKYDLYHFKMEIIVIHYVIHLFIIWQLLWCYILKYYLPHFVCYIVFISIFIFLNSVYSILPMIVEWNKQRLFIKNFYLCQDNISWSNYINSQSHRNYQEFFYFLATVHCSGNLLFIIDIIKYKQKLKEIINNRYDIDYGYLLPFNTKNHDEILPISPIVTQLEDIMNTDIIMENMVDIIHQDFKHYVDKYIKKNKSTLNITFITKKESKLILDELLCAELKDDDYIESITNIVISFDKALIKTDKTLQLLYREYLLTKI